VFLQKQLTYIGIAYIFLNLWHSCRIPKNPMKTKILIATATTCLLASSAMAQMVFTDDFNRADTTRNADATVSIGANYELVKRAGNNTVTAGILDNQVQFGSIAAPVDPSAPSDPALLYTGLSLSDTTVIGNSWTLSGQIKTHNVTNGILSYGLIFNRLSNGSFYAARIDTGSDTTVLQFIRSDAGGSVVQFAAITNTLSLALSSLYELSISSSAPGVFGYSLSGANITGSLSGTATDTALNLNGGYAGFYMNLVNNNPRFDNFSLTVVPNASGQVFSVLDVGETTLGGSNDSIATLTGTAIVNANGVDLAVGAMSGGTLNVNAAGAVVTNITGGNIAVSTNVSATLLGGSSSGVISGSGGLTKAGNGTLIVTASNSFTGTVDVQAGVLSLASATGFAAGGTTNVIVATNATLLIAQSDQVNNSAGVTLSGGTIQRASGVSEVFGNLNLTASSFLDFGGGTAGTITFSGIDYTPSALLALDIANFNQGSALVFQTTNNLSMSGFTFSGTGGFGGSSFDGSTFTITAIPEPSAYFAVIALLGLVLWPAARRVGRAARPAFRRSAAVRCPLFAKTRIHDPRGASNHCNFLP
jgi:autotransporter-associated beta strand protein